MKNKKDYILVLRVKQWIIEKIKKLAKDDKRKMSDYIRIILEDYVEKK